MPTFDALERPWWRACLLVGLAVAAAPSHAEGSLAVGTTGRPHFGLIVNDRFGQAEQSALKQCGKDCKIASRFENGCAAFASGRYAMGWNMGATAEEASFGALQQCREYGADCVLLKTACESKESTPGALVSQQSQQRNLGSRAPDAVLDIPPNRLRQVNAAVAFTFPKGSRFIRLSERDADKLASFELPSGEFEWLKATPDCYAVPGAAPPRWQPGGYPCDALAIAVPKSVIGETHQFVNPPQNTVPLLVSNAAFTVKHLEFRGLISAGTRLYSAPDTDRLPANEGYLWKKGGDFKWFYIDPTACVIAGKVFDCSQAVPMASDSWKSLAAAPDTARAVGGNMPSNDSWAVADVRTGMSPAEVRTVLERAGYKLTIYQSYYHYRHPVSGLLAQDDSVPMVSSITARAQAALPEDTVTVQFTPTPGAERAFSIGKSVSYTRQPDQAVSLETLRKTAIEKYGVPQLDAATQAAGNYAMYWTVTQSLGQLKPWMSEPDLGLVAIGCGTNALQGSGAAATFSHTSPLAAGTGVPPQAMRAHCGERFLVGRASLSPTGNWVNTQSNGVTGNQTQVALRPEVPVLQYQFWLYDAALAQAGQNALVSAEAELTARAARKQAETAAAGKPRL